jgi:hypothetical protein
MGHEQNMEISTKAGYGTTLHKSHASEYPAMVDPRTTQHHAMIARNRSGRALLATNRGDQ